MLKTKKESIQAPALAGIIDTLLPDCGNRHLGADRFCSQRADRLS